MADLVKRRGQFFATSASHACIKYCRISSVASVSLCNSDSPCTTSSTIVQLNSASCFPSIFSICRKCMGACPSFISVCKISRLAICTRGAVTNQLKRTVIGARFRHESLLQLHVGYGAMERRKFSLVWFVPKILVCC